MEFCTIKYQTFYNCKKFQVKINCVDGAINERADIFNNSSRGGARRLTFQDSRLSIVSLEYYITGKQYLFTLTVGFFWLKAPSSTEEKMTGKQDESAISYRTLFASSKVRSPQLYDLVACRDKSNS